MSELRVLYILFVYQIIHPKCRGRFITLLKVLPLLFTKTEHAWVKVHAKKGASASDQSQWTFCPTRLVIFRDNLMPSQALVSWKPDWWEMVLSSDLLSHSVALFCFFTLEESRKDRTWKTRQNSYSAACKYLDNNMDHYGS